MWHSLPDGREAKGILACGGVGWPEEAPSIERRLHQVGPVTFVRFRREESHDPMGHDAACDMGHLTYHVSL